jgi:hypothetical protein
LLARDVPVTGSALRTQKRGERVVPILPRPPWLRHSLLWGQPPQEADHEEFKILDARIRLIDNIGLMGEGLKKSGCTD